MSPKMMGAFVGVVSGFLVGGGIAYWYVVYGARLNDPGYEPSYNYAAAYIILAGAGMGASIGGLAGFLVGLAGKENDE